MKVEKREIRLHIRWILSRDIEEVVSIEKMVSKACGGFPTPWTEEEFLQTLRKTKCIGMVADHGDRIVGFIIYELQKVGLEIMKLAVHPRWQRLGIGRRMVEKLIAKLPTHKRDRVWTDVRETNLVAQFFFRSLGFRAIEVLRNEFVDSGEDGFRMEFLPIPF